MINNFSFRASARESMKLFFLIIALSLFPLFLSSCEEPSPFFGTWADNKGNTFSFFNDGTFSARVSRAGFQAENYNGNYTLLMNVLTLDCTNIQLRIVTEWDIRGNIMYLDWRSAEDEAVSLTLFKVSN